LKLISREEYTNTLLLVKNKYDSLAERITKLENAASGSAAAIVPKKPAKVKAKKK
jgi:DNA-binding ferritin-like protein